MEGTARQNVKINKEIGRFQELMEKIFKRPRSKAISKFLDSTGTNGIGKMSQMTAVFGRICTLLYRRTT
jgi:hypothetical protein